ncbi:MAG: AcrR family transcriptional regulator [Maribacter sp.]|jgi:AcrR family transcriptional regulator
MDKVNESVTKKEDLRVQRTKEWLFLALVELSNEMDFEKITISRLTKKAGIARQTFYRNYADIKDILEERHQQIISKSIDLLMKQEDFTLIKLVKNLVGQWYKNKELFVLMKKANLLTPSIEHVREKSKIVIKALKKTITDDEIEFIDIFLAGGIHAILMSWVQGRLELGEEVMVEKIYKLIQPILED